MQCYCVYVCAVLVCVYICVCSVSVCMYVCVECSSEESSSDSELGEEEEGEELVVEWRPQETTSAFGQWEQHTKVWGCGVWAWWVFVCNTRHGCCQIVCMKSFIF